MSKGFECKYCGKFHDELPMSYGSSVPDYVFMIFQKKSKKIVLR
ncbi:hypothetical protein ABID96_002179 [Bacillus sp. OAE603]